MEIRISMVAKMAKSVTKTQMLPEMPLVLLYFKKSQLCSLLLAVIQLK